ncbi:MAG: sterol desaturase family protein [Phaeodactylibacter sp.]|nr:sterol desaturase family protein [Phaeodactylibacter sp.]MCB9276098.1 sterol desaturase family protein [Lewinellaceae bacterium]
MKQKNFVSNENASADLFANKWLNYLTRSHISIPISMIILFSGWLFYRALGAGFTVVQAIAYFTLGFFSFTLAEYLIHRNLYHIEPSSDWRRKFAYIIHGVHHDYPKDKSRLAMPPVGLIIYIVVFFSLFMLLFGRFGFPLLSGFAIGYMSYLLVHYSVHAFRPPRNFLKALWANHAIHHYQDTTAMYGVTSPIWDYVFGTLPKRKQGKREVEVRA